MRSPQPGTSASSTASFDVRVRDFALRHANIVDQTRLAEVHRAGKQEVAMVIRWREKRPRIDEDEIVAAHRRRDHPVHQLLDLADLIEALAGGIFARAQ